MSGRPGSKETTIAEIAEAADVAASTFFLHFPTKEDLVFAGHSDEAEHLVERLAARRGSTLGELGDYVREVADPAWDSDLWRRRVEIIRQSPSLREEEHNRWADVVRPALVEAFAHDLGDPRPHIRARLLASMTVAALLELGEVERDDPTTKQATAELLLAQVEAAAATT